MRIKYISFATDIVPPLDRLYAFIFAIFFEFLSKFAVTLVWCVRCQANTSRFIKESFLFLLVIIVFLVVNLMGKNFQLGQGEL